MSANHAARSSPMDAVAAESAAPIAAWLDEPFDPTVRRALDRLARAPDVVRIAVMPDVHLAQDVCVGVALATRHTIYPQAVGNDIGCGMAAVALATDAPELLDRANRAHLLAALREAVPIMRHASRAAAAPLPLDLLCGENGRPALSAPALATLAERSGRVELGTLGRGNHFLELQEEETGRLWLMVHSGSRGMGPAIGHHHARAATPVAGGLYALAAETDAGQSYLADLDWARRYAEHSRRRMLSAAAAWIELRFGAAPCWESYLSCDHNHVRQEQHAGAMLWVHRKGAISAAENEPGIIPGSMGTESAHTRGRGASDALASSSHGAGRVLSRTEARRRIGPRQLAAQMRTVVYDARLATRLCEEAPAAYRDLTAVLRAQRALTRTIRRLRPLLVYKGV